MNVLRTPEERFANLPDYPFEPNYCELDDPDFGSLRMHYLDEGPLDGPIVVLLHGQGCWSYIFRHMIPPLAGAGHRVIVPDYIGFGKSDKLPDTEDYTFNRHVDWLKQFFAKLGETGIDGYFFDWGGFFGLRITGDEPDLFRRVAVSNANLPTGDAPGAEWFINWRAEQFALPEFPQGRMVDDGVRNRLSEQTIAAFDSPYPDESYKTGPRRFPMILPISSDMGGVPENRRAWEALGRRELPVLALFSADFRGTAMGPERLIAHVPGCAGQNHVLLEDAGFYIVEDKPRELAEYLVGFLGA